jgi:hypothetical protein
MAKSTRASGDTYTEHELSDPTPPIRIQRAMLGEVDKPSLPTTEDGGGSTQSSPSDAPSKPHATHSPQSHAQTTESPSPQQDEETNSDAGSTGGHGPTTETESTKATSAKRTTRRKSTPNEKPDPATAADEDEDFDF